MPSIDKTLTRTFCLVAALLMLPGCPDDANSGQPSTSATATSSGVTNSSDTSLACATFSRADCMRATHCTLVVNKKDVKRGNYLCREAKGPCEENLAQANRAECKKRSGCVVDKGGCYCHCKGYGSTAVEDRADAPGCACVCAGGPPVRCRGEKDPPSIVAAVHGASSAAASATAAASGVASAAPAVSGTAALAPSATAAP